jgi:FAD/FMN-containing dehydrogenase
LAQSGGHGWATTFDLNDDGQNTIIINMRGLNSVTFNDEKSQVTIGGGTIHSEWVEQSYANGVQARKPSYIAILLAQSTTSPHYLQVTLTILACVNSQWRV